MNKLLRLACYSAIALIAVGCGRSSSNWYAFDGGMVNLSKVTNVSTSMKITIIWIETKDLQNLGKKQSQEFEGPINKKNISDIKKCIREHSKTIQGYSDCLASLNLDSFTIRLPCVEKFDSSQDLERMIDAWLAAASDLFDRL